MKQKHHRVFILRHFRYTERAFFNLPPIFMLKNILLVLLILFPAALYIYMISRDDGTKPAEQKQSSSEQHSAIQPKS